MNTITLSQVQSLSTSSVLLFEVLSEASYRSGHLPGARVMPLDRIAETAAREAPDKKRAVVVYCASETCQNSHIAAAKLGTLGYTDVRVFAGGKAAWKDAGLALEQEVAS